MIIRYFNIKGVSIFPLKTDAPLIIYPYAPLSFPFALQRLKPVVRRVSQRLQGRCCCDHSQFPPRQIMKLDRQFDLLGEPPLPYKFGFFIPKLCYHLTIVSQKESTKSRRTLGIGKIASVQGGNSGSQTFCRSRFTIYESRVIILDSRN